MSERALLSELAEKLTNEQIVKAQQIFWQHACWGDGTQKEQNEKFRQIEPKWCRAIDNLPFTTLFCYINDIHIEITVDILKKAVHENPALIKAVSTAE